MKSLNFYIFLILIALLSSNCGRKLRSDAPREIYKVQQKFNAEWATDKLWDDGLAEVCTYRAERIVYGQRRKFDYTYVVVKETFNKEFNTKTNDYNRADLFEVMKLNQFCRIPTDNYPYHYLTSVFFKRKHPGRVHKLTTSSQEWCGNTFKAFNDNKNDYHLNYNSYWDGEGRGRKVLPGEMFFEDQLIYSLRALKFEEELKFEFPVLKTQKSSKVNPLEVYNAKFAVTLTDTTQLKSMLKPNSNQVWKVTVQLEEGKKNHYWFAKEYPNRCYQQESWNGRNLYLKNHERWAYWEH